MAAPATPAPDPAASLLAAESAITEEHVAMRVGAALAEAKRGWDREFGDRDQQREGRLRDTLAAFSAERAAYFKRVEAEVVQLSLAIARKILHREAGLDPTLLCGLVRIAIDRLGAETPVRVRVAPDAILDWERSVASAGSSKAYEVVADSNLAPGECVVDTGLGTANFGIEAQLKEIERSFLDLLAQRPELP